MGPWIKEDGVKSGENAQRSLREPFLVRVLFVWHAWKQLWQTSPDIDTLEIWEKAGIQYDQSEQFQQKNR